MQNLKASEPPQVPCTSAIRSKIGLAMFKGFALLQGSFHISRRAIGGIKYQQCSGSIVSLLEADDGQRVSGPLKIDGWKGCLVDLGLDAV